MFTFPPLRYWLPNFFTFASSFCGVAIIYLSASAQEALDYYAAALLIPIACVLDGFDGRVARWTHGQSAIGVQLDSMSDLLTFGVAPSFLLYYWALSDMGFAGLSIGFVFVIGGMLRLARFNVQAETDQGLSRYFCGLPIPMAAMGVAGLVCLDTRILGHDALPADAVPGVAAAAILLALMMVSNLPFRTFKDLNRSPGNILFVVTFLSTLVILTYQLDFLSALTVLYAGYVAGNLIFALVTRGWRMNAAGNPVLDDEEKLLDEEQIDHHI